MSPARVRRRRRRWLAAAVVALGALLGGCADGRVVGPDTTPSGLPVAPPASVRRLLLPKDRSELLVASTTVLDTGRGPVLCLGAVLASLPPAGCGGVPLRGWVWPRHGVERAGEVTWGSFTLVGTYDGKRFRFVRFVTKAEASRSLSTPDKSDFASACPEPSGGWRAPDPARATDETQGDAFALAEKLPGYGGSWIDDHGDPNQDPLRATVNVQVTGDLHRAEQRLREVWGGSLCVSAAARTYAELQRISDAMAKLPGFLESGIELTATTGATSPEHCVHVDLAYADEALQRRMNLRYGADIVVVTSALRPYVG